MGRRAGLFALVILAAASLTAMGPAPNERHCAVLLVHTDGSDTATQVDLGCYSSFSEAVAAGSGGAVRLSPRVTPATLTQRMLDLADPDVPTTVLIGTEYTLSGFTGSSKSYFAADTCSATDTWDVSYVTDAWNDDFESGRGFGGCDHNKKFHDSNFGGSVITCTPNCSDYGALANEVSSLRWKV
jgi:hypothetical protein